MPERRPLERATDVDKRWRATRSWFWILITLGFWIFFAASYAVILDLFVSNDAPSVSLESMIGFMLGCGIIIGALQLRFGGRSSSAAERKRLFSVEKIVRVAPPPLLEDVINNIQQAFVFEERQLDELQGRASVVRNAGFLILVLSIAALVGGPVLYLGEFGESTGAIDARQKVVELESAITRLLANDAAIQQSVADARSRTAALRQALSSFGTRDWRVLLAGSTYALVFLGIAAAVFKLEGRYTHASMAMRRRMSRYENIIVSLKIEWGLGGEEDTPQFRELVRRIILELLGHDRESQIAHDPHDIEVPQALATRLTEVLSRK